MSITNSNALVHTFYIWPQMGLNLSEQWGKVRENFENLHPLAKAAQLALDAAENHEPKNNDLSGLAIGERDFRNRWRTWYDPDRDRYAIQFNQGTEAQPVWDDFLTVRDSDGRVTVHGTGGLDSSIGGFYSPLPRNLAVSSTFTPASFEWQFQHNLNTKPILWDAYNLEDKSVTPITVDVSNLNIAYFYFNVLQAGRAIVVAEAARGEGIRVTDSTNIFDGATRLGFNSDDFYLSNEGHGDPVVNLQPIDLDDFDLSPLVRVDGTNAFAANESMGGFKLTNVGTPVSAGDAVNKAYADALPPEVRLTNDVGPNFTNVSKITFRQEDFYLDTDSSGQPVVNIRGGAGGGSGGGQFGTGIAASNFAQLGEWVLKHNLGVQNIIWSTYDDQGNAIIPDKVSVHNPNTSYFYFNPSTAGRAVVGGGPVFQATGADIVVGETDSTPLNFTTGTLLFNSTDFYLSSDSTGNTPIVNFRSVGTGDIHSDGSVAFAADESMGGFKLTNVGTPSSGGDAVNKTYADKIPGFYGITVKQTNGFSFRGINVIEFDRGGFYLGQNALNTDTVVVSVARDKLSINDGRVTYATNAIGFNSEQFYLSRGPVVNISAGYARSGCVTMIRSADSNNATTISAAWNMFNEKGEPVSTAGSSSEGLQEAINYAAYHGYDLKVYGGGIASKSGQDVAIINCTNQITVPPVQGVRWDIHATLNFGGSPSGTPSGIQFDSIMASDISFRGQIVVPSTYSFGVRFAPISELPQDPNGPVITACTVRLPSVVKVGGIAIELDCSSGGISSNFFEFTEPNGGSTGVRVLPGSANSFDNNEVRIVDCHAQSTCMNVGFSNALGNNCFGNIWSVQCDPLVGGVGIEIFSKNDYFNISVTNLEGQPANGVTLNNSAARNVIVFRKNDATTAYNDASSTSDNVIILPQNAASQAANFGGQKLSNLGAPTANTDTARLGDIAITFSDGVHSFATQSPARLVSLNPADFYLSKTSAGAPMINLR